MTVADQPSSRLTRRPRAAPSFPSAASVPPASPLSPPSHLPLIDPPQFPLPQQSGRSWLSLFSRDAGSKFVKTDPKPDADVVDLLIMETLDHPAGTTAPPAPSAGAPAAGGGDLLDSLVADHLERATHPAEAAAEDRETGALTGEFQGEAPADMDVGGADLLQREIEALLAGTPSATAPVEAAHSEASEEDEVALQPPLNQAELDVLLAGKVDASKTPAMAAAETTAPLAMPDAEDEGASKMLEAEGVLAEELAQLMAETAAPAVVNAPVTIEEAVPEPAAVAATPSAAMSMDGSVEAVPAVEVPQRPPGVPEHPIVELAGEVEGDFETEIETEKRSRGWSGIFSDVGLVAAQVADMPFRWIDVMDKNLLGVAAAVLLLSGIVLRLVGWWMGV